MRAAHDRAANGANGRATRRATQRAGLPALLLRGRRRRLWGLAIVDGALPLSGSLYCRLAQSRPQAIRPRVDEIKIADDLVNVEFLSVERLVPGRFGGD